MRGTTVVAAAAALLSASVAADDSVLIYNYCSFPVYAWSVDASDSTDGAPAHDPKTPHVISPGASYTETMRELVTGGVSVKLGITNDLSQPLTQLEYTKNYDLWYDVSNVNCVGTDCPFQPHGLYLKSGPGCPTVACKPGNPTCHGAYTLWDDNWASLCCPEGNPDVILYLCTDKPGQPASPPKPSPSPSSYSVSLPTSSSSSAPPATYSVQEAAQPEVTTKPKHIHHPKPYPVEPATEVVEVTEFATVVVTVTPSAGSHQHAGRHVHHHAHAHAHQ